MVVYCHGIFSDIIDLVGPGFCSYSFQFELRKKWKSRRFVWRSSVRMSFLMVFGGIVEEDSDEEYDRLYDLARKFVEWGEYLVIEIDVETGEAKVIPIK